MKAVYADWIINWVPEDPALVLGKCAEFCESMRKKFPELGLRKGFYHDAIWGRRMHYWLQAPDGSVVDPTVHQFPDRSGEYEALNDEELPRGKCIECGELYFTEEWSPCCSLSCSVAAARAVMGG